jgi:hypothetical protein
MIKEIKKISETYRLLRKLSKINGPGVNKEFLDRIMYKAEALPPLGKEYWWFLLFGTETEKPRQLMFLIFRKHGNKMLINDKEIMLKELGEDKFQGLTTGWFFDGREMINLGDTNSITEIRDKKIISEVSGKKFVFEGGFPNYKLKVGDIIDLNIKKANYLIEKDGQGGLFPPFGVGWVNVFLDTEGVISGEKFKGTAHFQKVVGVIPPGPFHWVRLFFQDGSMARVFCCKTGKESKIFFQKSFNFCDQKNKEIIKIDNPEIKISKDKNLWIIEGKKQGEEFHLALGAYAKKEFKMKGGGSQVYIEYAVVPKEFNLKTKTRVITLAQLGKGVGTLEDAYW